MVLQEEQIFLARVSGDLVHALAELGIFVRHKIRADTFISYAPILAAITRLINAAGRDGDLYVFRVLVVRNDSVQAQAAKARLPLLAVRVRPQAFVQLPSRTLIVRLEQGGR